MELNSLQYSLYKLDNDNEINALIRNETIWLSQKSMGELFGVDRTSISKHLKNIFETGELDESMVCEEIAHTTLHGAIVYNKTQNINSDFEKELTKVKGGAKREQ